MPDRLTTLEQTTLALDTARTPAAVGTVGIFEPGPSGMDDDLLVALVADRIRYVPRYRQRILGVPGRLADPVWVDDTEFDLSFHVRRSMLPRPGSRHQLRDFVGRVLARRMDRSRPLWELYLVDGVERGRFALVAKTHPCIVDGVDTLDLMQVLVDDEPDDSLGPEEDWHPLPAPGPMELVAGAVTESLRDPSRTLTNLQHAVTDAFGAAVTAGEAVGLGAPIGDLAAETLYGPAAPNRTPLAGSVSEHRRSAVVTADLDDLRAIRTEYGHPINDVLLEMITGGLRSWLMTRGENVGPETTLTATTPMSVIEDDEQSSLGSRVEPLLRTLPIGQPDAQVRLGQIADETQQHKESGRAIAARDISDIAGFAPATLHALGVRVTGELNHRPYDLLITNAPGPRTTAYLGRAPMAACYSVIPLSVGHRLAIGVTSYNGTVLIDLNADRDAFTDLDVLAQGIRDELDVLTESAGPIRRAAPSTVDTVAAGARRKAKRAAIKRTRTARQRSTARHAARNVSLQKAAAKRAARTSGYRSAPGPAARSDEPNGPATEGDR